MASSKTLFLAVYASNGIIRLLFLPTCYILLLSPFIALIGYYFGLGHTWMQHVQDNFSWFDLLPQITLSAVFLLLPTRLISGFKDAGKSKAGGKRRVQSLPYWIPGLQNLTSIVFGGEQWLRSVSKSSINNIVAYTTVGRKHNVITTDTLTADSLLSQIFQQWNCLQKSPIMKWTILRNAFGSPQQVKPQLLELEPIIEETIRTEFFQDAAVRSSMAATLKLLSDSLPDFVTFNSSIVDQMQWERVADVELTQGTSEAECNLFALVNEFCCNTVLPPLLGIQFAESYQLLATDLAAFNSKYWALALGLPRLSPIPGLPGAALAQKRLLHNFAKLFRDLTHPPVRRVPDDDESVSGGEETDADTTTPVSKMNDLFKKHDLPMSARSSVALQLFHGIMAEVVPLVVWSLVHICATATEPDADKGLIEKIKEQTKMWAQAIQPPSIHPSFPAPPEIHYGSSSDATRADLFPLPRACVNEVRRLYSTSVATYLVKEPLTIQEASIRPNEYDIWELDVGSYIDVGLSRSVINTSPDLFPEPKSFKPDRFENKPNGIASVASQTDTAEPYITALVMSIVVGILQLWEISPAPKKTFFEHMQEAREEAQIGAAALTGDQKAARSSEIQKREENRSKQATWKLPKAVDGSSVKVPSRDIRVRIRRREGLHTRKIGEKR